MQLLRTYRAELKNIFSSVHAITLFWLRGLVLGYYLVWLTAFANSIISYTTKTPILFLYVFNITYILIAANSILFKGLRKPEPAGIMNAL